MATISNCSDSATHQLLNYFSDWTKLKTAVAWILKFKDVLLKLKQYRTHIQSSFTSGTNNSTVEQDRVNEEMKRFRTGFHGQSLTPDDLSQAESAIIGFSQYDAFKQEMFSLQSGTSGVKRCSNIYKLDPVLMDGLLRVGGRLSRAAMPEETKRPVILPKEHHVSKLIMQHVHRQLGHVGRNHMLSTLRKRYWIINGNSACRKVISECVVCLRFQGKIGEQKMSDLPKERIMPSFFQHWCGLLWAY